MPAGNHDRRLEALEAASAKAGTKTFVDVVREALAVPLYKIPIPEGYTPTWLEGLDPELVRRVRACDDEQAYLQAIAEDRRRWRAHAASVPPPPDPAPPPPWFAEEQSRVAAAGAAATPERLAPVPPSRNIALNTQTPVSPAMPFDRVAQWRIDNGIQEYRPSWMRR
jgi:hypothetical protein